MIKRLELTDNFSASIITKNSKVIGSGLFRLGFRYKSFLFSTALLTNYRSKIFENKIQKDGHGRGYWRRIWINLYFISFYTRWII